MKSRHDQPRKTSAGRLRSLDAEQGSITLLLVILFPVLLALAGLIVDGGAKLREAENATALAQEAARAGAGMVNLPTAYATGRFTVDPGQAIAAAQGYLAAAGHPGTAVPAGPNTIRVTVTITQPTAILSIIGIGSMTSTGQATADLVTGVTGAAGGPGSPQGLPAGNPGAVNPGG